MRGYLLDNSGVILTDDVGNLLYYEDIGPPDAIIGAASSEW